MLRARRWETLWQRPASSSSADQYGRILLVKVGLSLFVLGCGAVNSLGMRFRPDLHTDPLPRTVALDGLSQFRVALGLAVHCRSQDRRLLEVVFALLVLAATGVLTGTAQPDMH